MQLYHVSMYITVGVAIQLYHACSHVLTVCTYMIYSIYSCLYHVQLYMYDIQQLYGYVTTCSYTVQLYTYTVVIMQLYSIVIYMYSSYISTCSYTVQLQLYHLSYTCTCIQRINRCFVCVDIFIFQYCYMLTVIWSHVVWSIYNYYYYYHVCGMCLIVCNSPLDYGNVCVASVERNHLPLIIIIITSRVVQLVLAYIVSHYITVPCNTSLVIQA